VYPAVLDADGPADEETDTVRKKSMLHRAKAFVQGLTGVSRYYIDRFLRDDRPVVDEFVDEMDGDAGGEHTSGQRIAHRIRTAERGQQRRMDVDDPIGPPIEERGGQDAHEAGEDDEVSAGRGDGVSEACLPARTVAPVEEDSVRRDARLTGTLERRCVGDVAEDSDEFGSYLATFDRCDERNEVASSA